MNNKLNLILFFLVSSFDLFAQAPIITSFTPSKGSVGTQITISGANFNITPSNNMVIIGATRASVTSASATQLTITVPIGATYAPIYILNTVTGLMAYSRKNFTPTFTPIKGSITQDDLSAKVDFPTETTPTSLAIGDLDGDGKADLVAVNENSNLVSVFHNTGNSGSISSSSFSIKVDFSTGAFPRSVKLGDLDGDGKADIVVANNGNNTVSVFRNTSTNGIISSSSFASKVDFATGAQPNSIAIHDLDGDGKLDMAVTNGLSNTVSVFRNTSIVGSISSTSFALGVVFSTGVSPNSIAMGDLDGDGKADMAITNGLSNTVSVFHNTASIGNLTSSSFAAKIDLSTSSIPRAIAIGDLNGDGKTDIIVTNGLSNTVSVFQNIANIGSITSSSFTGKVDFTTSFSPWSLALGDLDGDGKADLAVPNLNTDNCSGTVSVFRNTSGNGSINSSSFAPKVDFTTGAGPASVAIGDLDGDGKVDLAVANSYGNTISVRRNNPVFFTTSPPVITSFTPSFGQVGNSVTISGINFNTTPANNIVRFGATNATVTLASTTQLTVSVPLGVSYSPITVLDASTGLMAYSGKNFTPIFSPNKGSITSADFSPKVDFSTPANPEFVALGDLDGDGKSDMVIANSGSNTVSVFRNTSSNGTFIPSSFAPKVDFPTEIAPVSVAIGDLDGDGKLDLAVTNYSSNTVSVFRNTSVSGILNSSSFAAKVDFCTGFSPSSVAIGDLDGDGKSDLAVANYSNDNISVFRNTGSIGTINHSSFAANVIFSTGSNPISIAISDLNGDSKKDLVVTNFNSNTVSVFRNLSGSGSITSSSFAPKVDFTTGAGPSSLAIGDLDGDNKPDLVIANFDNNKVSVLHNTISNNSINSSSFAAKLDFTTGSGPYFLDIADLDGDGKVELAVANFFSNSVSVFRNTSSSGSINSSSFAGKVDFTTGSRPKSLAIADMDGDGKADLVLTNNTSNTVSVIRNNPVSPTPTISSFTPSNGCSGTALVTITGNNFTGTTSVTVGGTHVLNFTVVSETQITATIGAGTSGPIAVTTQAGTANSVSFFTVDPLPSAPTVPSLAAICAGTTATITPTAGGANYRFYAASTGGSPLAGGNGVTSFTTPTLTTNTTYHVASESAQGCESSTRTAVTVTVNPLPAAPTAPAPAAICAGTTATITPTTGGANYLFYAASTGGSPLVNGNGVVNFTTPTLTATTTYHVASVSAQGCESSTRTAVTVTVNPLPAAPTAPAPAAICAGTTATITPTAGGANYLFYAASTGGSPLVNGNGVVNFTTPTLTATTTYHVASVSAQGCESSTRTAVTVTVNPLPAAPTAPAPAAICAGSTAMITPTAGGANYRFYAVSTGGSPLVNGNGVASFTTPVLSATTTYHVASVSAQGCESSTRTAVTVTVNPLPAAPTAPAPAAICAGTTATITPTAGGANYRFYAASTGGSPLAGGNGVASFTTPTLTATTNYHVASVSAQGCESSTRTAVTVTVNPLPAAPTAPAPAAICAGTTATITPTTGGANYRFYAASTGGSPLVNGNGVVNFTTPTLTATTTYHVASVSAQGCESSTRTAVTVTVSPLPAAPTAPAAPAEICAGNTATITPTAGGANYRFYAASTGGSPIAGGNGVTSFTTPTLTATTTYHVASVSAQGCESSTRTAVTVTVNPLPAAPTAPAPAAICAGTTATITPTAGGANYRFYAASTGGSPLAGGNGVTSFTTPTLTTNTTYHVASESAQGCESSTRTAVTVTVSPLPAAPTAPAPAAICTGTTATITPTTGGANYRFYAASTGGSPIAGGNGVTSFTTPTLTATTTYHVASVSAQGCESSTRTAVTVTVNPLPSAPTAPAPAAICEGTTATITPTAGGANYRFYAASTGGSPLAGGNGVASFTTPTLTATTTYHVASVSAQGCESSTRTAVIVSVNPLPAAPTAPAPAAICEGSTATITPTAGGANYRFYAASTGGSPLAGGNGVASFTTPTLTATTTYHLASVSAQGCESSTRTAVTVTVIAAPTTSVAGNDTSICGTSVGLNGNFPIIGSGVWTIVSGTGGVLADPLSPVTAFTGQSGISYVLRWTISNAPCISSQEDLNVTFNAIPSSAILAGDDTICTGSAAQVQASVTGGTSPYSFVIDNGVGLQSGYISGTNISVSPSSTTTYSIVGNVTDANGCTVAGSGSALVTVISPPVVQLMGDTSVCANAAAFTLTASPSNGTFSGSGVIGSSFNPQAAGVGVKQVIYTLSGICTVIDTVNITVNSLPTPIITFVGADLVINNSFQQYQWFRNDTIIAGATDSVFTPQISGLYKVEVVDINGCLGQSNVLNIIMTGIGEPYVKGQTVQVEAYPNPFSSELIIEIGSPFSYSVLDMRGIEIKHGQSDTGKEVIRGEGIANGTYFLRVTTPEGVVYKKIIRQ